MEDYGFVHLSAGDLLRAEIASGSPDGDMISKLIKDGAIVPVSITCALIKKAMESHGWADSKFLIDGFPRNEENRNGWQAEMGNLVSFAGVLYYECADEEALKARILARGETSGRTDDNLETL